MDGSSGCVPGNRLFGDNKRVEERERTRRDDEQEYEEMKRVSCIRDEMNSMEENTHGVKKTHCTYTEVIHC